MAANAHAQNSHDFVAVTPSDSNNLPGRPIGLFVGGAGNVALVMFNGTAVTFKNVAAGSILPCAPIRVNSTNTTATDIVALY